jgi:hypothetical protein
MSKKPTLDPKTLYELLFAITNVDVGRNGKSDNGEVVCFDFFWGDFGRLASIISSLYIC